MSDRLLLEYRVHFRATLRLAWPIFVGQLGQVLMGVIDTAMVGKVGKAEVAAAGMASSVFFLFAVFGFGLTSAISPLVSIAKAKNNKAETAGILRGAYWASILMAVIIQALVIVFAFNLSWLKQEPVVESLGRDYLLILSFSSAPMLVFLAAKQFVDGLGYTRPAMFITVVAIALNAGLNWLLIYGHWGFPAWSLNGAGVATFITRLLMMLAILLFLHRAASIHSYVHEKPKRVLEFLRKVFALGIPSGFQFFFEVAAFSGAMFMAGWLGVDEQAAHQIAINTAALTFMGVTGISAAGSIRVGSAFGSSSVHNVRLAGKSAILMGVIWMGSCGLIMAAFRHSIPGLYIDNPAVEAITTRLLLIAALFQISDGVQAIGLGILRGIADAKRPTAITLLAYWVIGLPSAYLFGFTLELGVDGIWYGLMLGLSTSAILLYLRFNKLSAYKPTIRSTS